MGISRRSIAQLPRPADRGQPHANGIVLSIELSERWHKGALRSEKKVRLVSANLTFSVLIPFRNSTGNSDDMSLPLRTARRDYFNQVRSVGLHDEPRRSSLPWGRGDLPGKAKSRREIGTLPGWPSSRKSFRCAVLGCYSKVLSTLRETNGTFRS